MAHTNAPAHDFAPPWLKIPSYDSAKPSGADSERGGYTSHKEGPSYNTSARHTKESDNLSSRHPSYNDSRRERNAFSGDRKHSHLSSYHQSLDFEDSYFEGNGYHAFPSGSCNGTSSSNSHSSVRRPHSRHDFRNGPSYGKGDLFNNHMKSNGGYLNRTKSKFSEPSTNNSNSSFSENGGINVISNNFNQEFPSLQGDVPEEPVSTPVNGSVWEKPRNIKVHGSGACKKLQLVKKTSHLDSTADSSKRSILASSSSLSGSVLSSSGGPTSVNTHTVIVTPVAKSSSGIYRALVPAKGSSTKKQVGKEGGAKVLSASKKPPSSSSTPASVATYPMEILVKHPKACGNKSEFLKALRNENQSLKEAQDKNLKNISTLDGNLCPKEQGEKSHTNGIDIEKLNINNDNEKPLLSSSLEAEERLLREMGWKEEVSDDDNYAPLTEDEMREFKALSEQIAKKNGIRRNLQSNFSPRRLAPFPTNVVVPLPTDNCTSSSESDSDF